MTEPTTPATEHRGTLRIVGGASQSVQLELGGDKRWILDNRSDGFWQAFADAEVIVTGHCYTPMGYEPDVTALRLERIRFAKPQRGRGAILEVGPEQTLVGTFTEIGYAPGSKLEGSKQLAFIVEKTSYAIAGSLIPMPEPGREAVTTVRMVTPDLSFTSTTTAPAVWIIDILDPDEDHVRGYDRKEPDKRCP